MEKWNLPQGWVWTTLGEVGEIVGGGTPRSKSKGYFSGNIPWITPADLSGYKQKYIWRGGRNISKEGLASSSAKLIPVGSVLFSSRAPIGYVAIAGNEISTNQGFKSVIPNSGLKSSFVYYYFKRFTSIAEDYATGTTFKELSGRKMKELPFPLPPLKEQERIAKKLDKVFERLGKVQEELEKVSGLIKEMRQSIIDEAVSGGMTQGWGKSELKDLILDKPRNGYSPRAVDYETPIKSMTLSATTSGSFDPSYPKYLDIDPPPPESHLWLKKGDILVQRSNSIEYVGTSAIYTGEDNEFIYPDLMMKVRVNQDLVLNKYISFYLKSSKVRKYFVSNATGTAGNMPKINQKVLMNTVVFFPSEKKQTEIVAKVEAQLNLLKDIESAYEKLKSRYNRLPESILQKAFRGELVKQLPTDGSAEELLELIRKERESQGKSKKRSKKR